MSQEKSAVLIMSLSIVMVLTSIIIVYKMFYPSNEDTVNQFNSGKPIYCSKKSPVWKFPTEIVSKSKGFIIEDDEVFKEDSIWDLSDCNIRR